MLNAKLNQAIIAEIIQKSREGDLSYCKQLGFSEKELMSIAELSIQEIYDLCESSVSFASIKINHMVFWNQINWVKENSYQREVIDKAIRLGASAEMLHQRFGLSSADVAARRKLIGVIEPKGRKPNATEAEEKLIWEQWKNYQNNFHEIADSLAGLEVLMKISESCSVSLSEVSRLITHWSMSH